MNLSKSLIERRQLLLAALGSTCTLTCKKLAAFAVQDGAGASKSPVAASAAPENVSWTALKGAGNKCPHLLSPLRIRNKVLKNRIMHTASPTYFMQGPENFPTDMYRNHFSNMAKNAAIVTINTHFGTASQRCSEKVSFTDADRTFNHYCDRSWDDIPAVNNYINVMMDDAHYQGSLILLGGNTGYLATGSSVCGEPKGQGAMTSAVFDIAGVPSPAGTGTPGEGGTLGAGQGPGGPSGGGMRGGPGGMPGMPAMTDDEILADAKEYENKGYDVYQLRSTSLEVAKKLRDATDLILMARYSGVRDLKNDPFESYHSSQPTAAELEQAVEEARKLEGVADILWIRVDEHPMAWSQDKGRPKSLPYAEAIKKAGIKIITCPSAGFHDPVENDGFIAKGMTDMVGMTGPFFADAELVRKLKEGRADDVVPCIACQVCHGGLFKPPWYSTCTVNPTWGVAPYQLTGITKPKISKKVAVIGGGPGGMKAALVAAERGHKVTLYEKSDALGGLLKISDDSQWRWNYKDLKDYLIYQVNKAGIEVQLKTAATPVMIKARGYDSVLVATGSKPAFSELESAGRADVFNLMNAYYNKKALGTNVVIVGAGLYVVDGAAGMLKDGHKVTLLAPAGRLVEPEDEGAHNVRFQGVILANSPYSPNFNYVLNAKVKDITGGKVTYTDSTGKEKSVQADSIVIWSGLRPAMDEAEKFIGSSDDVLLLGDCAGKGGSIQKAIRSAFFVASQV